jgi:hypothetical protein
MSLTVERESLTTASRLVTPTYMAANGNQVISGVDDPLPQIEYGEQKLRDGKVYAIGVVFDFASKLGANASIDIGIAWNAGVTPTVSFFGLCTGDAIGFLYEGATMTGGTAATATKLNRNTTIDSQSAITIGPTVTNVGTLVLKQILIGGTGKKAGGGDIGSSNIIFKPLTSYLIRLTNANGTAHAAEVIVEWAE